MGEELRVLYVAMTRAKEVLVMTGTDRSLENKLEKWSQLSLTDGQIPYTIFIGRLIFRLGTYGQTSCTRGTYESKGDTA